MKKKVLSSLWNRTSDLQIPLSDALPLTPPYLTQAEVDARHASSL